MRIRTVLAAAILAAVAGLPLAGVASARPAGADRDCRDFASQAAAQTALDPTSGDPQRLDADGDGVACEDYFGTGAVAPRPRPVPVDRPVVDHDPGAVDVPVAPGHQIPVKPRGAPDTGDGSAGPLSMGPLSTAPLSTAPLSTAPLPTRPADAAALDAAPPGVLAAGLGAVAALAAAYLVVRRTPTRPPIAGLADRRRGGGRRRSADGLTSRSR
jgi:hypothetical protein